MNDAGTAGLGVGVSGRVSVIVPAYNYAQFLDTCLQSVLTQPLADLELVVVDDGSTDETAAVAARFPRIQYLYQPNQGLSAARNTGMRASSGEYLLFLDADDLLAPDSLAARLDLLRRARSHALSVCRNRLFTGGDEAGQMRFRGRWWLPPTDLDLRLRHFNIAPPHAFLLRREVAAAVGWFDTSLRACEDYDYWFRALLCGYAPIYSQAGSVYYRKHAKSMSADNRNQLHHDALLHQRVLDALLGERGFQPTDRTGALLAAYAGAYTTLARLADCECGDYKNLSAVLHDSVPALQTRARISSRGNTVLHDYYTLLLLQHGTACAARDARAADCFVAVFDALAQPGTAIGRWPTAPYLRAASRLFTDRHAPFIDRFRTARLLTRRLTSCMAR